MSFFALRAKFSDFVRCKGQKSEIFAILRYAQNSRGIAWCALPSAPSGPKTLAVGWFFARFARDFPHCVSSKHNGGKANFYRFYFKAKNPVSGAFLGFFQKLRDQKTRAAARFGILWAKMRTVAWSRPGYGGLFFHFV